MRLAASIKNTPHLITVSAFNVILDYLDARNESGIKLYDEWDDNDYTPETQEPKYVDGLAVLNVDGSLTYKPVMTLCGEAGTSYTSLVEEVEEMAEAGVRTIVMNVTSGGGEASHVFQACNDIRATCDENDIKLIGYADTCACSAAYALISICDEIVANPSSDLGSIGCVICLLDTSKAMDQAGYKRIFIASGEAKVPYAEDGTFKKEFLDGLQEDVDRLNLEFASHVNSYTGIPVETILAMQAKVYNAQEAVEMGLANKVMTNKEFAAYVAEIHQGATYA